MDSASLAKGVVPMLSHISDQQQRWEREAESADEKQAELLHTQWALIREQISVFSQALIAMRSELQGLQAEVTSLRPQNQSVDEAVALTRSLAEDVAAISSGLMDERTSRSSFCRELRQDLSKLDAKCEAALQTEIAEERERREADIVALTSDRAKDREFTARQVDGLAQRSDEIASTFRLEKQRNLDGDAIQKEVVDCKQLRVDVEQSLQTFGQALERESTLRETSLAESACLLRELRLHMESARVQDEETMRLALAEIWSQRTAELDGLRSELRRGESDRASFASHTSQQIVVLKDHLSALTGLRSGLERETEDRVNLASNFSQQLNGLREHITALKIELAGTHGEHRVQISADVNQQIEQRIKLALDSRMKEPAEFASDACQRVASLDERVSDLRARIVAEVEDRTTSVLQLSQQFDQLIKSALESESQDRFELASEMGKQVTRIDEQLFRLRTDLETAANSELPRQMARLEEKMLGISSTVVAQDKLRSEFDAGMLQQLRANLESEVSQRELLASDLSRRISKLADNLGEELRSFCGEVVQDTSASLRRELTVDRKHLEGRLELCTQPRPGRADAEYEVLQGRLEDLAAKTQEILDILAQCHSEGNPSPLLLCSPSGDPAKRLIQLSGASLASELKELRAVVEVEKMERREDARRLSGECGELRSLCERESKERGKFTQQLPETFTTLAEALGLEVKTLQDGITQRFEKLCTASQQEFAKANQEIAKDCLELKQSLSEMKSWVTERLDHATRGLDLGRRAQLTSEAGTVEQRIQTLQQALELEVQSRMEEFARVSTTLNQLQHAHGEQASRPSRGVELVLADGRECIAALEVLERHCGELCASIDLEVSNRVEMCEQFDVKLNELQRSETNLEDILGIVRTELAQEVQLREAAVNSITEALGLEKNARVAKHEELWRELRAALRADGASVEGALRESREAWKKEASSLWRAIDSHRHNMQTDVAPSPAHTCAQRPAKVSVVQVSRSSSPMPRSPSKMDLVSPSISSPATIAGYAPKVVVNSARLLQVASPERQQHMHLQQCGSLESPLSTPAHRCDRRPSPQPQRHLATKLSPTLLDADSSALITTFPVDTRTKQPNAEADVDSVARSLTVNTVCGAAHYTLEPG